MKVRWRKIMLVLLMCGVVLCIGQGMRYWKERELNTPNVSQTAWEEGKESSGRLTQQSQDWGLAFGQSGEQPTGNAGVDEMKQYNAYYMGGKEEKVIYLTFDCGYENGNTEAMLDALKKHGATATFFVVGHYLESAPDLVKRMVAEGHVVGNHTYHHPHMSGISTQTAFEEELRLVREKYKELIGEEMCYYYRPPQGKFTTSNLEMANALGYKTFFWSLAYADWDQNNQPSVATAMEKLTERIHPGAVVLLHNTSSTNAAILDELLTMWEEMGYTFRPLSDLAGGGQ